MRDVLPDQCRKLGTQWTPSTQVRKPSNIRQNRVFPQQSRQAGMVNNHVEDCWHLSNPATSDDIKSLVRFPIDASSSAGLGAGDPDRRISPVRDRTWHWEQSARFLN